MIIFFHQILKARQILFMIIFVCFMMSVTQAKAETPSYQLDQDKHLVVDYLYRLINKPKPFNEISDLTGHEWQNTHLTSGDLLIRPGENWFAIELINNNKEVKESYLELANQVRMKNVDVFVRDRHRNVDKKSMQLNRSNTRSVMITVAPYSSVTLYLTIESDTQLRSTVMVYSAEAYIDASSALQFQQGILIGGILCLSIAFMLLFFATGYQSIFILSGYFLSNTLMLSAMLGFNLYYLLPHLPELIGIELPLLTSASAILLLVFTAQLFDLKSRFYTVYQVIRVNFWGLLIYMPLSIQLSVVDNISISMAIYALIVFSLIVLGIYLHRHASRLALLFTVVMAVQFVFVLVVIASVNWFDIGFVANRSLFYGIIFWTNCLLVTFILSRQYRYHLLDKQEAQRQALTSAITSERAQEELLRLQSQSQEELENRVQERTLELNIALQELEEANHELEQKNTLDELTGLFNRRFYDQKILAEYRRSKRNLTPLSLVLIDIDHFKAVNDTYGHLAGDSCLAWLSEHIKQSLKRSTDMAFRYGGEEFCLILPDTDGKGAVALAEALRHNIAKQACIYKEIDIPITISNGIFTYLQQDNVLPEQIFSSSDKALYQAKHDGRNQYNECPY
jgi:diguanylate cyclase (GGDEF)-like protein